MSSSAGRAPTIAPYGSWASPLSAEVLAAGGISFGDLRSANGRLYWTENVPARGGAIALFSLAGGSPQQVTPDDANVRTRVHEYGGAPFVVNGDTVYYSQYADQRLYALRHGGNPQPVTPPQYRYADCIAVPATADSAAALICVREDHTDPAHVRNTLVRLPIPIAGAGEVLFDGSDFVSYPRLSPDGRRLAFIAWNHPNMPWDGTELHVAELTARGLTAATVIAGGAAESVQEPQWDSDGTLYFISDRSGFWNLYGQRGTGGVRAVWPRAAEFAGPLWSFGQSNYVLFGDGRAVVAFRERGISHLAVLDLNAGTGRELDLPYVEFSHLTKIDAQHIAAVAGASKSTLSIVNIDIANARAATLHQAGNFPLEPGAISAAVPIDFPSAHGRTSHAFYYAPTNPRYRAVAGLPPLLAFVHGGPTGQSSPALRSGVQYWTSRGFAVVDVNYGGSSGYGRAYRQELNGNWGVVDAEDVIAAVRFLIDTKRADPKRTAISGGSAGGYTVLVALSTSDVFRAGADHFGVSDMTALARDTHKFESRYIDSLIGPLPEAQAVYDSRSPLNHLDGFKVPVLVLQGADDPVVPPNQSQRIVEALRARHVPVAYVLYPGEGHGFRKPENIINSLQAELSFYGQVFGFKPADQLPPLVIEGLAPAS